MAAVHEHGSVRFAVSALAIALAWPIDARQAPAPVAGPAAVAVAPLPSDAEIERFLLEGKTGATKGTKKGVTGTLRVSMSLETLTHDAQIQIIDEYKREFRSAAGVEFDFRDSWSFNVAAYKIDRLLGLNMVPVSVQRSYRSTPAAFTWWLDAVLMDEGERRKQKIEPPDRGSWSRQNSMMHLFDQLIGNVDRNMGNIVYTKDWRLWAIDHTRAFRKNTELKMPSQISRCDRQVFERLKTLDRETLKRQVGKWLDDGHIKSLLARRDLIVKRLDALGPSALFDRTPVTTTQ